MAYHLEEVAVVQAFLAPETADMQILTERRLFVYVCCLNEQVTIDQALMVQFAVAVLITVVAGEGGGHNLEVETVVEGAVKVVMVFPVLEEEGIESSHFLYYG